MRRNGNDERWTALLGGLRRTSLAVAAVGALWVAGEAVIHGPQQRAIMESRIAGEIAQETRTVCREFGMRPGTRAFRTCADELARIRRRHAARVTGDIGLL